VAAGWASPIAKPSTRSSRETPRMAVDCAHSFMPLCKAIPSRIADADARPFRLALMKPLSRRTFLRGAGVCLALPLLEAMLPARIRAAGTAAVTAPRRVVAINIPLGFIPEKFFPTETGASYALSEYLQPAEALRNDFTLFSGTSHPGVDGGHSAEKSFLTAAPSPGARTFRNTISLDQFIARQIGDQ